MTTAGLGGAIAAQCEQEIPVPGPEPHPVWSPAGDAIAWEEADGIWTETVADLSGTDAGCQANGATARLVDPRRHPPGLERRAVRSAPGRGARAGGGRSRYGARVRAAAAAAGRRAGRPRQAARRHRAALAEGPAPRRDAQRHLPAALQRRRDRARRPAHGSPLPLGRRAVVVARGRVAAAAAGRATPLRLRFTGRARRRLARAPRVALDVAVVVRSASGRSTQRAEVTLRR